MTQNITIEDTYEVFTDQSLENEPLIQEEYNAFYLKGSAYLPKDKRHVELVKGSKYEGWLIPRDKPEIVDIYNGEYEIELVFDPIIEEPKEIQHLIYLKSIKQNEKNKKYNEMVATLIKEYGYNESSAEEVIKFAANNLWRDS